MALTPMFLRLETPDGFVIEEYRVLDGEIETRKLRHYGHNDGEDGEEWHPLSPDQLTDHVNRNTIVAQWLERRLGWRRLLRACVFSQDLYHPESSENAADHRAA